MLQPSSLPGIEWPVVPSPRGSQLLAVLAQLEQSQWLSPEALRRAQSEQLAALVAHAWSIPFYRQRLSATGLGNKDVPSDEAWSRVPVLSRPELQLAGAALYGAAVPAEHGPSTDVLTSGSTGRPVKVLGNAVTQFFWEAFTLRDHVWHGRDLRAQLAAIRYIHGDQARPPDGLVVDSWGEATAHVQPTGPCALLDITSSVAEQSMWLATRDPVYLLSYPSNVVALARHMARTGASLNHLREVRTFGEVVEPHVREVCREVWDVPVVDMYTAQEVGYIALQCPEHERYHVQSESVLVEVLGDDGTPCQPGEVGKVVVTSLHNYASPLLRYQIGDFAEVGEACPCGRGLPVLERIVGRQRNMVTLPDGTKRWPSIQVDSVDQAVADLPPILQSQIIQHTVDDVEMLMVATRPLTEAEEQLVLGWVQKGLGHPFDVRITYVDDIPSGPTGKFEDIRSEVP